MKRKSLIRLFFSIFLCQVAAFAGALITMPAISGWYVTLRKPPFTPPGWVFGVVWGILFFLMAYAFFLILETQNTKQKKQYDKARYLFFVQLGLNFLWSLFFFGWHAPAVAFVDILILWAVLFATIRGFEKLSKLAAYLLYPYLAWVSFAAVLNFLIIILNP